ncbi:hypothetical protein [Falsigemmobacter faecalis]|uniref:O-antigen ligase domain-containing protein n=1 Tax=Falsigemmobacter faecalis TaxID=2488730 RepID=A0A3P3DUN3_9RHOB|nr:hypothetical protein [Falsigemmobacter faecalis]RRH77930.1 hypothetical protein EG244_02585 [Falsigemmobacter faecalis]
MPNLLAYTVLLLWPLVVLVLFKKLPPGRALIWSVLSGYMWLPPVANFDPPVLPPFDKNTITILACWCAAWSVTGQRAGFIPKDPAGRILGLVYLFWPVVTILSNAAPVPLGRFPPLPGMTLVDLPSLMFEHFFGLVLLGLARQFLTRREDLYDLLYALMLAGLIYSAPMVVEVVLSPQLNTWIFGFFQHDFGQMMRQGGFRPIVFMTHGLWVALFAASSLWAALALTRHAPESQRAVLMASTLWLMFVLVLCKSLGVLIYSALLIPAIWLMPPRLQLRIALILALLALCYPIFRASPGFPEAWLIETAARIEPARAQSLEFRLVNETILLDRAGQMPWAGWGGYGRNMTYSIWDGRIESVTDGRWIIMLGMFGWPGFLAEFGLLSLPILRAGLRRQSEAWPVFSALALMLAANIFDLLPNATLTTITWLIAGALWAGVPPAEEESQKIRDPFQREKRTLI